MPIPVAPCILLDTSEWISGTYKQDYNDKDESSRQNPLNNIVSY